MKAIKEFGVALIIFVVTAMLVGSLAHDRTVWKNKAQKCEAMQYAIHNRTKHIEVSADGREWYEYPEQVPAKLDWKYARLVITEIATQ